MGFGKYGASELNAIGVAALADLIAYRPTNYFFLKYLEGKSMGLNARITKIPFTVLYLILAGLTSFNWIRVILFQKNFEAFRTAQPWDYYLSSFFPPL